MLKQIVFLSLLVLAKGRTSPNGQQYLDSLSPEDLKNIPEDILEDALLDVGDLIAKYEYPVETHEIETEDGYLLTIFRINGGRHGAAEEGRIPVLLVHGLTGSAADWILNKPDGGLAYILADKGYDVWLGNVRGNYYSRKHVTLDPETRRFWMFSWNEIGYYDLPAMIDFVLEKNGHEKLHYAGHSQGTTSFFVMGSLRPDYNNKILSMHALAPVAYMTHARRATLRFSKYADGVQILATLAGRNEILPKSDLIRDIALEYCHEESEYMEFCINFFYGENYDHINTTRIPIYMGHYPAGSASRQFVHYAQLHHSKSFRQYDRGFLGNIAIYGRLRPPKYPLGRITSPVALYFSDNDETVAHEDVFHLHEELANPIGLYRVARESFNHLDFIIAMDAREQVYESVVAVMEDYD